jgi:hypothetical protein
MQMDYDFNLGTIPFLISNYSPQGLISSGYRRLPGRLPGRRLLPQGPREEQQP